MCHSSVLSFVLSAVCSHIFAPRCMLSNVCSFVLLSYVCSHMCFHMCAPICAAICVLSNVCPLCALTYIRSQMCAPICVLPYVCSAMSALMCSHMSAPVCSHMCVIHHPHHHQESRIFFPPPTLFGVSCRDNVWGRPLCQGKPQIQMIVMIRVILHSCFHRGQWDDKEYATDW